VEGKLKKLNSGGIVLNVIILLAAIFLLVTGNYKRMSDGFFVKRTVILVTVIILQVWLIKRARRIYFDNEKVYFKSPITGKLKEIINIEDVVSFESTGVSSNTFFYFMLKYNVDGEARWKIFIPNLINREIFYQLVFSHKAFKKEDGLI